MDRRQEQLGEILIRKGLINANALKDALDEQQRTKEFLGSILVRKNKINEKDLLGALSEQFNIPFLSLKFKYIDWNFVGKFSSSLVLDYKCLPLEREDSAVTVAITNPLDVWAIKKTEEETRGLRLKLVLVSEGDMEEAIKRYKQYLRGKHL
jgi:type IV pilus assembly protein PilB